jgi:hypothetical protein
VQPQLQRESLPAEVDRLPTVTRSFARLGKLRVILGVDGEAVRLPRECRRAVRHRLRLPLGG